MLRKLVITAAIVSVLLFAFSAVALADNPPGTGPPSQTCVTTTQAAQEPGHAASSPGSPFNEVNGIGGSNYSPKSQYDVACFQVTQHHL